MTVTCGRPSRGRYIQGCRCAACTEANNAYEKRRVKDRAKEAWGAKDPYFTDAEPVRVHLLSLLDQGFTKRGIAVDVGVFGSLREFCAQTGRSLKHAQYLCTPTARNKKMTYIERVIY